MGFLDRFKNARDVTSGRSTSLPLAAPTRLRLPIDSDDGPSLPVFVFDPALLRGDTGWETTLRIHRAASATDPTPIDDINEVSRPLRDQIEDDSYFGPVLDRVTDDFVAIWTAAGQRIGAAERELDVRTSPRTIGSSTSAALTLSSLSLEPAPLALLAQCLVRDSYAFDRMRHGGGPSEVDINTSEYPAADFRLLLFARPWALSMNTIEGWVSRFPLPSNMRDQWLNALINAASQGRHEEAPFVETVLEAMRKLTELFGPHDEPAEAAE